MKHIVLSVFAAACTAFSAAALDASNARIWLDSKMKAEIVEHGSGMGGEKKVGDTSARKWQMVKIPVHVEGTAKGDHKGYPHFVPELKLRISLAIAAQNADGKEVLEMLTKEVTYVEVPLNKHSRKEGMGENVIQVAVFISPANAYKLSPKDGSLDKKLVGVAVEGTFGGSNCNRAKEKPNDGVETGVVFSPKYEKELASRWWTKHGGKSGAVLSAISETPFAPSYAAMGFPATNPMYGAAEAGYTSPSAMSGSTMTPPVPGGAEGGPVSVETGASGDGADSDNASEDEEEDSKGKKGKKSKKSRRSSRN